MIELDIGAGKLGWAEDRMWPTVGEAVKNYYPYRRGAETKRKGFLFSKPRAFTAMR